MYPPETHQPVLRSAGEMTDPHPVFGAFMEERVSKAFTNDVTRTKVIGAYMGLIKQIDDQMGELMAFLDAKGLTEETMIVFTSDHGDYLGDHWMGEKYLFYEAAAKVPLIIYDPRSPLNGQQHRCNELTGNIDFAPTILEFAGLPAPSNMDGKSLIKLLRSPEQDGHEQMSFINVFGPLPTHSLTCLTKRYKYTYWWYGDDQMQPTEELFDTQNDPLELVNLASDSESSAVLETMRTRYDEEVAKWKQQAVNYNDYQRYGTLFDRTISMDDKQPFLKRQAKRKSK